MTLVIPISFPILPYTKSENSVHCILISLFTRKDHDRSWSQEIEDSQVFLAHCSAAISNTSQSFHGESLYPFQGTQYLNKQLSEGISSQLIPSHLSSQFPLLYIITVNNYVDLLIRLFVCFATNPSSYMGKNNIASFYVHGTKHNGLPIIKAK